MVFICPLQKNKFHCDWGSVFTYWADIEYVPNAVVNKSNLVSLPEGFFSGLMAFDFVF